MEWIKTSDRGELDDFIEQRAEVNFTNPFNFNQAFKLGYKDCINQLGIDSLLDKLNNLKEENERLKAQLPSPPKQD